MAASGGGARGGASAAGGGARDRGLSALFKETPPPPPSPTELLALSTMSGSEEKWAASKSALPRTRARRPPDLHSRPPEA